MLQNSLKQIALFQQENNMMKEEIIACYERMYQGMIKKDVDLLSASFDDSFILIHMTGIRQSKKDFIQDVLSGVLNYYQVKHEHYDVHIQDKKALLIGQSLVNAAVFGSSRNTWRLQLSIHLVYKNNRWLMTHAKASSY